MEKFVFPQSMGYIHKTVNVPRKLYNEVNEVLKGRLTTFSEFAVAAMEFTLKILKQTKRYNCKFYIDINDCMQYNINRKRDYRYPFLQY